MSLNEFKLDCAFLHSKLVIQLLHPILRQTTEHKLAAISNKYTEGLKNTFINSVLTDTVPEILKYQKTDSLEKKLLQKQGLKKGELVWMEQDFYFKGASKAKTDYENTKKAAYANFYTTLTQHKELKISGQYNAEHLFGDSSVSTLSGRKNVFMFAYIDKIVSKEITLRPVFIGRKMLLSSSGFNMATEHLQVYVDDIDEFKLSRKKSGKGIDINFNKKHRESTIKKWFGEIIHENNIPKDWGGEKSDLFCDHIHIGGKRYNAAFLFKGPAKFEPMTVKQLGKNGDQIVRLYDEPAEIYFLHHCHYVRTEIHKIMRAFSGDFRRITRYCIIDGIDTIRVLKAYKKI